jgi:hypothetical protein
MQESATKYKELSLEAFLDIGAFDKTWYDVITQAAERHGIEPTICRWTYCILERGNIIITLSGYNLRGSTAMGCLQGGTLLPLLRSLVVAELWWALSSNDYYTIRYADDIAILINGKPLRLSEVLQTALGIVQQWHDKANLSINPSNTVILSFTRSGT